MLVLRSKRCRTRLVANAALSSNENSNCSARVTTGANAPVRELQGVHLAGLWMGQALPASAALPVELTFPLRSAAVLGQWPASSGYVLSQAGWHAELAPAPLRVESAHRAPLQRHVRFDLGCENPPPPPVDMAGVGRGVDNHSAGVSEHQLTVPRWKAAEPEGHLAQGLS